MSPPGELAMFLAVGLIGYSLLFGPIGSAIARRLAGSKRKDTPDEIEQVNERVAIEVDELRGRLAEVEERLDFAERLLARGGEADQIREGAIQ
jgi:hypothetical protein